MAIAVWLIIQNLKPSRENPVSASLNGEESLQLGNAMSLKKLTIVPESKNFRETEPTHVRSFSVLRHSIIKGDDVIWNDDKEEITNVQESPDGKMILFFKCGVGQFDIYREENGKFHRMDIQLPHRDQANRVDGWYWAGNDTLIGEHIDYFNPVPQGYADEGWMKGSRIYAVDLKNKTYFELRPDELPKSEPDQFKVLKDEFDPTYTYQLPIWRFYKIKGITNEGIIFLESFDTSSPKGANAKDEGAFALKSE